MIRPITLKPTIQPKVATKPNTPQITKLQNDAAKLREQIRLANKMGEREAAAQARQELTKVTAELTAAQQAAAPVNITAPTGSNGTNALPLASSTQPTLFAANNKPLLTLTTPLPVYDPKTTAKDIANDVAGGKSIPNIAAERKMSVEQVHNLLNQNGLTVTKTDPTGNNGDVQTTKIVDGGRTITQYYDYQHDTYYSEVTAGPGTTTTPVRDGAGRKQTSSYDDKTKTITTTYVDDMGSGDTTVRVSKPNGATIQTVTPGPGPAEPFQPVKAGPVLPVREVTSPDGSKTELAPSQKPGGETTVTIQKGLADGKGIDQIAREMNLTPAQVTAELHAAGLKVTQTAPKGDNGDVQTVETFDPVSNVKTTYYNDYQHDQRTVVTVKDGKETRQSVDGFGVTTNSEKNIKTGESKTTTVDKKAGRTTETVVDNEGRTTKTDDVKGAKTTTVSFNGYTLTTKPNGDMTLHDDTLGTDFEIKGGSENAALARAMMAANPNSSDPARAKEGQVIKTFVEGVFAGEALPALQAAAKQKGIDKNQLIEKYKLGPQVQPQRDENNKIVDPFGPPPPGNAPSGGKWIPVKVDGVYRWLDPEVAKAIAAENTALSQLTEGLERANQKQTQLDVYLLDPAYKGAIGDARRVIDKALAPFDLVWRPKTPKGTLAEANTRLAQSTSLLEKAVEARTHYQNAEKALPEAIASNQKLLPLKDPNQAEASAQGAPRTPVNVYNAQVLADRAKVHKQFADIGLSSSLGDQATVDYMVGDADRRGVAKDSDEYKGLLGMQTAANSQVELSTAYSNYFDAHANRTAVDAKAKGLENQLLIEYNSRNQHLFEPDKKHSTYGGDYLGKFVRQEIKYHDDGQISVINHFEEGTTEQKLTYSLNDKNVRDEFRDRPLNKQWQDLLNSAGPKDTTVCVPSGLQGLRVADENAATNLNKVLSDQLGQGIENLNTTIKGLQDTYNKLLGSTEPGSTTPPPGTLADGEQPVTVKVGDQTIKVAPGLAEAARTGNLAALEQSGKFVWIVLDPKADDSSQGRWVDPRLAVAKLRLDDANKQLADATDLKQTVDGYKTWHETRAKEPDLLYDTTGGSDYGYLTKHQQETLDSQFQPQFQNLLNRGYDNKFRTLQGDELKNDVAQAFGLNPSNEDDKKILDGITSEIHDAGGAAPQVSKVGLFYVSEGNPTQDVTLYAVKTDDGLRYVDRTGKIFENLGDFQDANRQFDEKGKLVAPKGLEMKTGDDGKFALEVVQARNVSVMDRVVDPLIGIGTGLATIASFTPLAPVAAPLAYTGAAYLGYRAVVRQVDHLQHGGEWDDTESVMNVASVVTTALPTASSFARTIGMWRSTQMGLLQSFRGAIGATSGSSSIAGNTKTYMQSDAGLNKFAYGLDAGSIVVGAPLLVKSAYDVVEHGEDMNGLEFANAVLGIGTGITGTGLGIRALRQLRPGSGGNQPGHGQAPAGGPAPMPKGPNPQPAAANAGKPQGAPAVAPVVAVVQQAGSQGGAQNAAAASSSSTSASASSASSQSGSHNAGSQSSANQSAGATNALSFTDNDSGAGRLVWDPATKTFAGGPEQAPPKYTYTSGKDPKIQSAYLGGLTADQMLAKYQTESLYLSRNELAERYGPDGYSLPQKTIKDTLPDFRVGVTFRVRLNTGQFGIGSPTLSAAGFGFGTKTHYNIIGWSMLDSISQRSWTPLKNALVTEGVVSFRAREYNNITGLQAGVLPFSNQTALPVRASDLGAVAREGLFSKTAGYDVRVKGAHIADSTPEADGSLPIIEVAYTPSLKAKEVELAVGEHDFFGVPGDHNDGHVQLQGTLPFDRVMTEFKTGIRLPLAATHVDTIDQLPRVGYEKRPESKVKDTLKEGDVVSRHAYDQIQSALGQTTLRARFVVKDPTQADAAVTALKDGDIGAIQALVAAGHIVPEKSVSFAENPVVSGFRLSAVPGKTPMKSTDMLNGEKVTMLNPEALLIDVIFNDRTRLPGPLSFNPDKFVTSKFYGVKQKVQSWLPERWQQSAPTQPRSMPLKGNIYQGLYKSYGTPETRHTWSLSTPPLSGPVLSYSAEVRVQFKSKASKAPSSIAKDKKSVLTFDNAGGKSAEIVVPEWLATSIVDTPIGAATIVPKGGKESLKTFLKGLEETASPAQKAEIETFRNTHVDKLKDDTFLRSDELDQFSDFLATQAVRPENGNGPVALPSPKAAPSDPVQPAGASGAKGPRPAANSRPLTDAEIAANHAEATRLFDDMIVQDLGMSELTVADFANQFSRSPTMMGLLRDAHGQGVRIINGERPDLQLHSAQGRGHDINGAGTAYDPRFKVIRLDPGMLRLPGRILSRDVIVGEHTRLLVHELAHVTDAEVMPSPAAFTDGDAFANAFVAANLRDEGRARLFEFQASSELAGNSGIAAKTLGADVHQAELAIFERYQRGDIDAPTAIHELSLHFAAKPRSTDMTVTYQDHYGDLAGRIWSAGEAKRAAAAPEPAPDPAAASNVAKTVQPDPDAETTPVVTVANTQPKTGGETVVPAVARPVSEEGDSGSTTPAQAVTPKTEGETTPNVQNVTASRTNEGEAPAQPASAAAPAKLTGEKFATLKVDEVEALTGDEIATIPLDDLRTTSPDHLRKFTPSQLLGMSDEQKGALSLLQLTTFRATHNNRKNRNLTESQKTELNQLIKTARRSELKIALVTFGTMAGASTVLWTALPRPVIATAAGVAFAVRGGVFTMQAFFPNATAATKKLGKSLNVIGGLTFSTAAPGALISTANGTGGGLGMTSNGTFTGGNFVYGTKTSMQAFTNRPVLRNIAEHFAGPAYILGSAAYGWQSIKSGSPIDITAGAMFTFGCAEFWASAIRTDLKNRRPVPRTDAEIQAMAKSDARWAMTDRITLGVTFGVGMFLFSWSALAAEPWKAATPADDETDIKAGDEVDQPDEDTDTTAPDPTTPGATEPRPTEPPPLPQLVVVADDGLNMRIQPGEDGTIVAVLEPGTFVRQTDQDSKVADDRQWLPVQGYGADEKLHDGWVAADYVAPHAKGASNARGRTNPELEARGYQWVEAKSGQQFGAIVRGRKGDVAAALVLNMDHLLNPSVIFPGDRVYLPA